MEDRKIIKIEDDADEIIVDSPAEVYGSLSEAYASIRANQDAIRDAYASIRSSQNNMRAALDTIKSSRSAINAAYASIRSNQETMRNVSQSMGKSLQKICDCSKLITPAINKEALASMTAGLCKVAEATKAISSQYDFSGTATALSKLSQSMAKSNAIAETIRSSSTLAMTESVRKSMAASSRALSEHFDIKGFSVPAEQLRAVVATNRLLPENIPTLPATAMPSLQSSLAAAIPKPPSILSSFKVGLERFAGFSVKIAEWIRTSPLFEAATSAISKLREYLQVKIGPLFETLRAYKDSFKRLALRALLYLHKRWLSRRRKPLPLDDESFRRALALQPLGPVAPVEYIEFANRIRIRYLRKHQRISEDTDALNDNYMLAS